MTEQAPLTMQGPYEESAICQKETAAVAPGSEPPFSQPLPYNTAYGRLLYEVSTQEYWVRTLEGVWLCLHKVEPVTISKDKAKKFQKECKSGQQYPEEFPKRFPTIKTSRHAMLTDALIYHNAVHDSILVKRTKNTTGFAQFCVEKNSEYTLEGVLDSTRFLRPKFTMGCPCIQLQTYGPVVYCPTCTTYRLQQVTNGQLAYTELGLTGKLTTTPVLMRSIVSFFCCEVNYQDNTKKLNVDTAVETFGKLFQQPIFGDLDKIPLPKDVFLTFLWQSAVLVTKPDGTEASLLAYLESLNKQDASGFHAGHAFGLLRLGVAVATLGMIA